MMIVTGGSTDVTTYFSMRLLAGGDGTGLTIADFDMQYVRTGATPAAKVDAVALAAANTAHTDNRGIEVDSTDTPGLYRFDWPDAAFAAGVREVILSIKHTSCFTEHLRVEIDPFGAPAGASLAADVAAVKSDTAAILLDTGTDGVVVASLAANSITAAAIANGAIDAATFAADVDAEILSYIVDDATRIDASALNTAAVTSVPAIKTQTDKFVFTVANQVNANIQYVNDVAVNGTGAPGDEWGP